MPRIEQPNDEQLSDESKEMLSQVKQKMGKVPNVLRIMAQSPAALKAYLSFSQALESGHFSGRDKELIALAVSQVNACNYCLAAHTAAAKGAGADDETVRRARLGEAEDPRMHAALAFARAVAKRQGWADDDDLRRARDAGLSEAEILELIAHVAFNVLTNYTNHVAETDLDFEEVQPASALDD